MNELSESIGGRATAREPDPMGSGPAAPGGT